jgi:hypothetical protein
MPKGFNQYKTFSSRFASTTAAPICQMSAVKFYANTFKPVYGRSWKAITSDAASAKRYCSTDASGGSSKL